MVERGLTVDHSTIGRWVLRYAPELHKRIRRELRPPNRSWRVDETYIRVAGAWTYLYRAVDSTGETIDFMLSPKRDVVAAKHFLQMALWRAGHIRPRVINVDGHASYPLAIAELKESGELGRRCQCRPCPYLNNVLEQDHRFVKKRVAASLWFRSVDGALRTIASDESVTVPLNDESPNAIVGATKKNTVSTMIFIPDSAIRIVCERGIGPLIGAWSPHKRPRNCRPSRQNVRRYCPG